VWQGSAIARLEPGGSLLKPRIAVGAPEYLFGAEREAVQARLEKFLSRHVAAVLEPLVKLEEGEGLAGICKGIAFRLVENFGILPRDQVAVEVKALAQEERASLRALGVRFGAFNIHVPAVLKPAATELRLLLWGLERAKREKFDIAALPAPPGHGLTSAPFDRATPKGFYRVCGYRICGPRVVRIDMLERLADFIRHRVFWRPRFPEEPRPSGSVEGGGFAITPEMMSLVGCSGEEFQAILRSLDFRMQKRRVKKPKAPPVKQPEAIASLPESAAETPAPLAHSNEAAAETPPAPLGQPAAETPPAGSDQAAAEPDVEIEVWWPKDAGPFHRPSRQPHRPRAAQKPPKEAQTAAGEVHTPKLKPVRHKRERAPERQPSPDSPFAVLGELRARLAAKKS
jgi:ATP-dependent RNA helicase SUPV3L1/SUV3